MRAVAAVMSALVDAIERECAACRVQSGWALRVERKQQALERRRDTAAISVQAHARRHEAQRRLREVLDALALLQASSRGAVTRSRLRTEARAAVHLSAAWRRAVARTRLLTLRSSAQRLQAAARAQTFRREAQMAMHTKRASATLIQSRLRAVASRRATRLERIRREAAALWICACSRRLLARQHIGQRRRAVATLQTYAVAAGDRRRMARAAVLAAVRLQAGCRRWRAQALVRDKMVERRALLRRQREIAAARCRGAAANAVYNLRGNPGLRQRHSTLEPGHRPFAVLI